jgi:hypothetical protein
MIHIRQELEKIYCLIHDVYRQVGILKTIVTDPHESNPLFSGELDKLVSGLEKTVLRARNLNESCYMDIQQFDAKDIKYAQHWSNNMPGGRVEVDANGWLHITLDALLPHCKRGSPWLRDTLLKLLYGYKQSGRTLRSATSKIAAW